MNLFSPLYVFTVMFFLIFTSMSHAQEVAITIDDPNCGDAIFFTQNERDQKILAALEKHHVKAAFFVVGACVDNQKGKMLLRHWNDIGLLLGNHTYSHKSINEMSEKQYEEDTLRNEALLKKYPNYKKILRFPMLKEGNTAVKRDEFRAFLRKNQYEFGSVTIDASDWYINSRLEKRLLNNPNADITPYKMYYLDHMWDRAQYYDKLAKEVIGRSPKHTLLMHHNLLNALFLNDLIQMFKDRGWKVINADEAFQDPVFKITPNTLPAGESLIWAIAKETGRYDNKLRYPGESDSYEKDAMDKLGL